MSEQHTPGPWRQSSLAIYDARNRMILQIGVSADRCFGTGEMEANAQRIVACVNACAGITTNYLETILREGSTIDNEVKQRISASNAARSACAKAEQQRDVLAIALTELRERVKDDMDRLYIDGVLAGVKP